MRPLDWAILAGLVLLLGWCGILRAELLHVSHALRVHIENRARHSGPGDGPDVRK